MARKAWLLSLGVLVVISLGIATLRGFCREKKSADTGDIAVVSEKIEELLKNQQDIIARLEDIRAQQDIIRVRASRR